LKSDQFKFRINFLKRRYEIAGFLAATIAWGNRKMIINNSKKNDGSNGKFSYDFVIAHSENDLEKLKILFIEHSMVPIFHTFIKRLNNIYKIMMDWKQLFQNIEENSMQKAFLNLKSIFEINHQSRTQKHVSDPLNNSAAKRINMFPSLDGS
jgi:hypothetical protein